MLDGNNNTTGTTSNKSDPLNVNSSEGHPYNRGGSGIAENAKSSINTGFVLAHTIVIALGFA